ncbi:hypothetical protein Bca52824_029069 [Brassica carinata]|uniref:Uncharacterized protein n=1 Tax=Brassica carinata TaxID=52824 RepID=A0A8X7VDM0_BRACI|nr:hypothetical protein Bca52824_029069 [Brassica carinata]
MECVVIPAVKLTNIIVFHLLAERQLPFMAEEKVGQLVRLWRGYWKKQPNGQWIFFEDRSDFGFGVMIGEGETFESLLARRNQKLRDIPDLFDSGATEPAWRSRTILSVLSPFYVLLRL